MTDAKYPNGTCFVIAPIGAEGSDTRKRSDDWLKGIIRPAAKACGFKAVRADEIDKSGNITSQVIRQIIETPMVIADLTELNPNVFYEMAIRHVAEKPIVHIIQEGSTIPFDVQPYRTIHVGSGFEAGLTAIEEIGNHIRDAAATGARIENPVTQAQVNLALRSTGKPEDTAIADMAEQFSDIRNAIKEVADLVSRDADEQPSWSLRQASLARRLRRRFDTIADMNARIDKMRQVEKRMGSLESIGVPLLPVEKMRLRRRRDASDAEALQRVENLLFGRKEDEEQSSEDIK